MIVKLIEEYHGRMKVNLVIGHQLYHANSSKLDDEIENNFHFEEDDNFLAFLQENERNQDRPPSALRSRVRKSYSRSPDQAPGRRSGEKGRRERSSGSPDRGRRTSPRDKSNRERRKSSPDSRREPRHRSPKDLRNRIKSSKKSKKSRKDSGSRSRSRSKSLLITITRSKSRSRSREGKEKKRKKSKTRKRRSRSSSSREKDNRQRKRRQQLSDRSPTPPPKSKDNEEKRLPDLRGCKDNELSENYNRVRFLKEEGLAVEKLVQEKKEFIYTPTKHAKYKKQWELFYRRKEKELGAGAVKKMDLKKPWSKCWGEFLEEEFKQKCATKKRELEIKYRIKSLDNRIQGETVTLSGSESDDEVVELKDEPAPLPPEIVSQPSTSKTKLVEKGKSQADIKPNLSSILPKVNVKVENPKYQVPDDELNVLSLLKILMALSSKGLLDSERVKKMQDFALTLEDGRFGSSQMLVDEKECFNTVDQAGESLRVKLNMGQVPEIHKKPVHLALDQIRLFIAKSSCQRSDILEVANFSPLRSEDLGETKMKIAKTIEQELRNCNSVVTQEEFNKLVEAEYVRVKYKMSSKASSSKASSIHYPQQAPHASVSQMSQPSVGELFNTYLNPPPAPHFPPASRFPQAPAGIQPVDWGQICRALEVAKSLDQRRSPPRAVPSVQKQPVQSAVLEEEEIVSLIRNINQLDESSQLELKNHMKELERLDPGKVQRIKKRIIDMRNMR